ncbi:tRNA uracil 4-sulfurtransferase ThiI [Holzapfeliella floricola]|uniref:Probable tRNA sulfurtransferase n=1 Tax=Holzapfeliella floricola DSM 23037 = JCM 16512 TaxID=1423744 RepID=A0A0R2DHR2_9LACO|nr:tRNA uracil 4-sulfurtransferase ThiI [Holzapfeliella floricola]KRN03577.1 thiamine biosynthesis tRNA modification protein ThiI [Holzapfeliella floricola DSM 23037 = JCM 16512]
MEFSEVLVRYGELSTKGKNRREFINRLHGNVSRALHDLSHLDISTKRDRMHIKLNGENWEVVDEKLSKVFGIETYSPAIKVSKNIEDIQEAAVEMMKAIYHEGLSFKVNTRRSDHEYDLDTNEINQLVGGSVTDALPDIAVKMKNPDVVLRIEVRHDAVYLSNRTIKGAGGLPVGTAGKAMLMLSGGIDSPVASYLTMKRGIEIEMVHFYSPPYTTDKALAKAKALTSKLAAYSGKIKFIAVPFAHIQEQIKQNIPEGYLMTVQRRFMLKLTDLIREQRKGLAISNGESIGQVASQTLESMMAINDVTTTPIIRPVATLDKTDIIRISEKIDTFDLSVMPFEDCCTIFAPTRPKTRPKTEKAVLYENALDSESMIQEALDNIQITDIYPDQDFISTNNQDEFEDLL